MPSSCSKTDALLCGIMCDESQDLTVGDEPDER